MTTEMDGAELYRSLGVKPVITASGSTTAHGGSKLRPEVMGAMNSAASVMVEIDELNRVAGKVIAEATGAEAGFVASGAAGGLVLQAAAVIGRQFPLELIEPVALVNGELPQFLKLLEGRELILPATAGNGHEFRFCQAMVQDAIYDGLLGEQRAAMHLRAGEAIERLHGDHIGEWSDALAHHFGKTTHTESPLKYLALAGRKSLGVYALDEAAGRFAEADRLVRGAPDAISGGQLAEFLLAWVRLFYYRKDFRALRQAVEHYIPRIEKAGDRRTLSLLLFWQGFSEALNLESAAAESYLDRALDLARDLQDEECIGYACMGLLYLHIYRADRKSRDSMAALAGEAE